VLPPYPKAFPCTTLFRSGPGEVAGRVPGVCSGLAVGQHRGGAAVVVVGVGDRVAVGVLAGKHLPGGVVGVGEAARLGEVADRVVDEVLGDLRIGAGGQLSGVVVAERRVGGGVGVVDLGEQAARVVGVAGGSA